MPPELPTPASCAWAGIGVTVGRSSSPQRARAMAPSRNFVVRSIIIVTSCAAVPVSPRLLLHAPLGALSGHRGVSTDLVAGRPASARAPLPALVEALTAAMTPVTGKGRGEDYDPSSNK